MLLCRDALNFTENRQKSNGVFLGKSDGFFRGGGGGIVNDILKLAVKTTFIDFQC